MARNSSTSCHSTGFVVTALILAVLGCAGDSDSQNTQSEGAQPAAQQTAVTPTPSGPVDRELLERGEGLFRAKGCNGCHTIGGGRLTGPDLAGVTERREYGWVLAMITQPDSMIKTDPTARQLFAEYMTPMLNMNITPDEARAIYEFLRGENDDDS